MTRRDIVDYCTRRGILLEAWAPLVEAMRFNHPALTTLVKKYNKESAQILLRYSLQKASIWGLASVRYNSRVSCRDLFPYPNHHIRNGLSQTHRYMTLNCGKRRLNTWIHWMKVSLHFLGCQTPLTITMQPS